MPIVHLIEGPVGAGKSTFGAELSTRASAPHLILDDWMATLFRPDRPEADVMPWYLERKERCIAQIWKTACAILDRGSDVVLELGLIHKHSRRSFYNRVDESGHALKIHVLDAPTAVRRERVLARNRQRGATFSFEVPESIFELASSLWEPLDDEECRERDVRVVQTTE